MGLAPSSSTPGGGSGTVTSVTSADTSISVATGTTTPVLQVATMDVLFTNEPPAASVPMNAYKLTGLANGSASTDALAVGQVLAANAIPVADLAAGLAGQLIGGTGPGYLYPPGYEIGYDAITAPVLVSSTAEATGTAIISCAAHTFDGAAVMLEVFASAIQPNSGDYCFVSLFESTVQITRLCYIASPTALTINAPVCLRYRFTPSAASHTYTITGFVSSAAATVRAGAGGTGGYPPAFARFTKV